MNLLRDSSYRLIKAMLRTPAGLDLKSTRTMSSPLRNIYSCRLTRLAEICILIIGACAVEPWAFADAATSQAGQKPLSLIANPASVNCVDKGGELIIEKRPDGGEYGVCRFKDGKECEEWAMMRGECPVGGVKISGLATPAARFCMMTGGTYTPTASHGTPAENSICRWKNGDWCEIWDYYNGICGPTYKKSP
jgi:hypothetical protein